jgi:hypothetical protein
MMNAIKLTGIVAAGTLLASSAAFAGPKWTYVEATYTQGDEYNIGGGSSSGETDNDYLTLGGSFGFADMYHVGFNYLNGSFGGGNDSSSNDFDGYEINFGVNPAITDDTDFVTNIFYTDTDFDTIDTDGNGSGDCSSCLDTDGYGAKIGVRSMITDKLEMSAYGLYGDYDVGGTTNDNTAISGNVTWAEIGGQYYWTEALSVGLDALIDAPATGTALRFSGRWSF